MAQLFCVPANIENTATSLPRPLHKSGFINVKLKNKLEYKGNHLYTKIIPHKVFNALHHLKSVNPLFAGKYHISNVFIPFQKVVLNALHKSRV